MASPTLSKLRTGTEQTVAEDPHALGWLLVTILCMAVICSVTGIIPLGSLTTSKTAVSVAADIQSVTGVRIVLPGLPVTPVKPAHPFRPTHPKGKTAVIHVVDGKKVVTATPEGIPAGFTFPLITTKADFTYNYPYGVLTPIECVNPPGAIYGTACHHDYLAADLRVSPGKTVIVAMVSGTISDLTDPGSCDKRSNEVPRLHIASDEVNNEGNSKWYFYYTHMLPGSLKHADGRPLAIGDHVEAGEPIALGGTSDCAHGSMAHTHCDVSHTPGQYNRPSLEASRNSVDIMPMLRYGFAKLP